MLFGANRGIVSSLRLILFWLCLLGTANVVYGYVATHQLALFSSLSSRLVTGAAVYVFIVAVSVGMHAFTSRLNGRAVELSLLSASSMVGAAVAYLAFVAVVSRLASVSLNDAFRIIIPNLLFFAIPTLVIVLYSMRRSAKQHAIDPSRLIGTAAVFLLSAVVLYILKAQLDLSGMPDILGRFAVVLLGIVVPSYLFISTLVAILTRCAEPLKYRNRTLFLAGLGAFLVPLAPIIG